ncbi:MAG: hypothetical protein EBS05_11675 [Proteobacteria bacterium]|nr:hypothetical protein [Pseudomonadota bacterium]
MLVVCFTGVIAFRSVSHQIVWQTNHDKLETIERLQSFRLPQDAAEAGKLCTAKGYGIWIAIQQQYPDASAGFSVVGFKNSGSLSDVLMVRDTLEGVSKVHVRLVRNGTAWRLDDVYLNQLEGRAMNQWASDAVEHPILASAKFHQPEIVAACGELTEVIKGTADFVQAVSTIVKAFKSQ